MKLDEFKNVIWVYTRRIEENMNCVFNPVNEKHGLTMLQIRILIELHHGKTHTIGSLAERVCVAGANISAMCKKLEALGLLERFRSKEDERVVMVALTERGREIVQDIDGMFHEKFIVNFKNETEEIFDDIILGLKKLNDMLEKMNKVAKE